MIVSTMRNTKTVKKRKTIEHQVNKATYEMKV